MLLLHGFGDTPQTLGYMAAGLHAAGFTVRVPLLPGHGRTVSEFSRSRASDWISFARDEYLAMAASFESVGLGGLSMGGALAAAIAADAPRLPALVLLAPYVGMPRAVAAAALLHRVWGPFAGEFTAASNRSILDPVERAKNLAYGVTTASALRQLLALSRVARKALHAVRAPTLIMQARLDNRVASHVARYAYATIPAREKELVFVERGGHILTVDYDRETVLAKVTGWFTSHMP